MTIIPSPTTPPDRSLRAYQAVTLSLLFLAGIVNFLDRASLSVANVTIRHEMSLSATQMGWLLSAFSLSYGLAQLPLIGLLDRLGTRSILGGGLALWSAAQLLTGFVRGFPAFLVLRVILGAGEAPFYPSGVRSVREWFTEHTRGKATAIMSMSQTIGLAIAPPTLTWLMLRIGWRGMFILLGGFGLLVSVLWITFHRARRDTAHAEQTEVAQSTNVYRLLLSQRTAWGMMFGFAGINYTNWLYTAWLPGYLQEQHHLSLTKTGWLAAIPFLSGAAGMISSGAIADSFRNKGFRLTTVHRCNLVGGMLVSAGSTWFVATSHSVTQAVAGISAALFCIHFAGTSGWGYTQTVSPSRYVAGLSALQTFFSFMVASIAPVLTGFLLDRTHSFNLALGVCSAVALLGALSYATLAKPHGPLLTGQS